jgi:hypothetical protein
LRNHATFDYRNAFWFSLVEGINKKLRAKDTDIATITSIQGMLRVLALYYSGLLPLFPVDDKVFGITVEEVHQSVVQKVGLKITIAIIKQFLSLFECLSLSR